MQSCAWINGQYRRVGPAPQSSQAATQLTHDTMRNWQAGTTDNSCQYRTLNTGVQPPQRAHFTYRNGASPNRQTSNWQTSAFPHQAVSSQQPAGENTKNYHLKVLLGYLPNPAINTQSGNSHLLVTNGFPVASQQDFHQSSAQNSSSPPNMMKANTTYPQQNTSPHWNQSVSINGNVGHIVSDLQPCRVQKSLFQNVNGAQTKGYPTSLPREQVVCNRTLVSATAHNRQTAHNQNNRQNSTQHGISPSIPQPCHNTAVSQSFRNNNITTNSSSSEQILPVSLNPAADTQQEMLSRQMMIARIADDLRKSFNAGPDGRAPAYTSSHNSNVSQSLLLNSGLSLPQTTHSVMSGAQQRVDVPPQQNSVRDVLYVKATGDGSGNGSMAANVFFPKSNRVSEGNQVGSLSDASQPVHLPETQSSVANSREMLEKLSSVKANDSSIHSSPGRTGTRAVAVVQPLSQDFYRAAGKHTSSNMTSQSAEHNATDECLRSPEKLFISPAFVTNKQAPNLREGSNLYSENTDQMRSNKSVMSHSAASNDGIFVSSSDSARHQDLSQKQLCADDTRSQQRAASTAQQSATSEVPVSQSGDKDKSENATDPKPLVFELSSFPTIPWTVVTLTKLVMDDEKAQMQLKRNFTEFNSMHALLIKFWDGSSKNLACKLKTGWYRDLITDVQEFCIKHVTSDSVILSQVKHDFQKQLQSYLVLKDNEVYSEPPYKSSWLNVNEQLDDIDKEFGFQYPLKHRLPTLESDNNPHQVGTGNNTLAQILSEVSNKVLSQTEPESVDSGEDEQASTAEVASAHTASPNKTSADSSDPFYSFEIQVLPPEEAKVIFEQAQSNMQQSVGTDSQPERVMNSSVEGELPEVIDVTLSDSKVENRSVCAIEQICCISRWVEIIVGSETSLTECQCKKEQRQKDSTDKTPDKEEMPLQKKDKLCAIRPDSKFRSAEEGENQAKGGENINNQIMTFSQTIDCAEDSSDKESKNISQISLNSSQSSIILISENEDEDLFRSENEIPNQMPDLEKDSEQAQMKLTESSQSSYSDSSEEETKKILRGCTEIQSDPEVYHVQDQLKSTGSRLSCTLVSSDKEIETRSSSESEENCGRALLTSTDVEDSSLETEEQTDISAMAALQRTFSPGGKHETVERKRKRPSGHDRFFPFLTKSKKCKPPVDVDSPPVLEGLSKCRKVFFDKLDSEPLASNVRTAELVLFGSAPQDKCSLISGRKSHISSRDIVSDGLPRPPKVLTVKISPLRRKSSETVPTGEYSVKRWIHEKWRRSFPPTKIGRRSKLKTQKCTFSSLSGVSLKKAEIVGPTITEELPVSSEMRIWNGNPKCCLSLKRRRALSNGLKCREEKTKKDAATLKQRADGERSNDEDGSHAVFSSLTDSNAERRRRRRMQPHSNSALMEREVTMKMEAMLSSPL